MRNGDISNVGGFVVAFRLDECLVLRDQLAQGKIAKFFHMPPKELFIVDPNVERLIDIVYRDTECTVALYFREGSENGYFEAIAERIAERSDIRSFRTPTDIYTALATGQIHYYVDNFDFVQKVSHPNAVAPEQMSSVVRRRRL